jgi:hypothetical protein
MSELKRCVAPNQEIELAKEIERLFVFQDRPLSDARNLMIVKELSQSGVPFKALVAGIRKLCSEDLKQVKISVILKASREFMVMEKPRSCALCHGTGFIDMMSKDAYPVSYACNCDLGRWHQENKGVEKWHGKRRQYSKQHGVMTLTWHYDGMDIADVDDEDLNAAEEMNYVPNWQD